MRESESWTIAYSAILSFVCAASLTVVSSVAKPHFEANKERERKGLTLRALGIPIPAGKTIEEVYAESVKTGKEEGIFEYWKDGRLQSVAFDEDGQGLWGVIVAYVALEPDLAHVRSIAVYRQEETPGLGAEIATDEFRRRFAGKRLVDDAGALILRVAKAGSAAPDEVDGISGATLTGEGVNQILAKVAERARALRRARGEGGGADSPSPRG